MAIQAIKRAIVLVSGFESRVSVSHLGLPTKHGTRNARLETDFFYPRAAFMSETCGALTFNLNQLAPLFSLPKISPFCCAAYIRSKLTGSKAKASTKLWLARETSPSSFFQLLPASKD